MATITQRIREHLLQRGPATAAQIAAAIPELAECGGEQRALLLMRLDPELERAGSSLWVARGSVLTDEMQVRRAAREYFEKLGKPGAPLSSAAAAIAQRTSVDSRTVRQILAKLYLVSGSNVFNRLRQSKEI